MELQVYSKPKIARMFHKEFPEGAHLTITEAASRVYFTTDIVEKFKLLSFPPKFGFNDNNEWYIIFSEQDQDSFELQEYRGAYFFHYSDIVHRILSLYNERVVYFTLEATDLPMAFKLVRYHKKPKEKFVKKSRKKSDMLTPQKAKTLSYYDRVLLNE